MFKKFFIGSWVLAAMLISSGVSADNYFGIAMGSADIEGTDDSSLKFYGGSRTGNMGFEIGYHDLGKQEESAGFLTASVETTGIEISGVGYLPVDQSIDLFAKIGLLIWDMDLNLTGFPPVSESGNDIIFGAGLEFGTSDSFALRLELQKTTLDVNGVDLDTDIMSVGATFKF